MRNVSFLLYGIHNFVTVRQVSNNFCIFGCLLRMNMGSPYFINTLCSAVDKPEFMGRPPDHPWWKIGSPESLLGCPNYFDLSFKDIFLIINTKFACFLFNQVPTYRELGRPLGDFGGHVGSTDRVMGRILRLGDLLSAAVIVAQSHHTTYW